MRNVVTLINLMYIDFCEHAQLILAYPFPHNEPHVKAGALVVLCHQ